MDGLLQPDYTNFDFHRIELNLQTHFPVFKNHTISARVRAGSILGSEQPDFFDYFLGGLVGMREYPFYSISGNKVAWLNLTYRFPLAKNIDTRIGQLYVDKLFLSFFGDIGNAWTGKVPSFDQFKKGVGSEIRVMMNSFYIFPTAVFFSAAYGFDGFTRTVNDKVITYGKEWRFYGGIAFGFDF